jgi:hypothetical protein
VIPRSEHDAVLAELELQQGDVVDPEAVRQLLD